MSKLSAEENDALAEYAASQLGPEFSGLLAELGSIPMRERRVGMKALVRNIAVRATRELRERMVEVKQHLTDKKFKTLFG